MDRPKEVAAETVPEEKRKTDEGETVEIEKTLPKNEKQILRGSSSDSPIKHQKRKSEPTVECETKRKKGAECEQKLESENKNLIYSSSIQEAVLLQRDSHLQKDEETLASTSFSGNLKEQTNVNPSSIITLKEKNVETADQSSTSIQALINMNEKNFQSNYADKNETNPTDAKLQRQDTAIQVNLDSCIASSSTVVQISSMNLTGVSNVESENTQIKLDSTSGGNERSIVSLQTENNPSKLKSDSNLDQPKSCLSKSDDEKLPVENKNVDSVGEREASSKEIEQSYYVSLQMKKNTTYMNKIDISSSSDSSESNQSVREILKHKEIMLQSERELLKQKEILLQSERELLEQKEIISALLNRESRYRNAFGISYNPSQNLGSGCELVAEFDQYSDVYKEPEFTTTEHFQADAEFIQTQQAILESHSRQHHSEENVKFESKIKDERRMPAEDYSSSSGSSSVATDDEITLYRQNIVLKAAIQFMKHHAENLAKTPEDLNSQLTEYARNNANDPRFQIGCTEPEKASAAKSTVANEKTEQEPPENSDKEANPRVLLGNLRFPPTLFSSDNSKSPSVMSPGTENPRLSVVSPTATTEIFKTPIKSPSPEKHEDNESSKTDDSGIIFREYPGIAEEPTKVKKDARYQKKFYKQKPVKLPINWNWGIEAATNEPEMEADQDQTQRGCSVSGKERVIKKLFDTCGNDSSSLPVDRGDGDEPVIIGEKKPSAESDLPNASESGVQNADGYKLSSFKEETPSNSSDSEEESGKLLSRASEKKSPKSR